MTASPIRLLLVFFAVVAALAVIFVDLKANEMTVLAVAVIAVAVAVVVDR